MESIRDLLWGVECIAIRATQCVWVFLRIHHHRYWHTEWPNDLNQNCGPSCSASEQSKILGSIYLALLLFYYVFSSIYGICMSQGGIHSPVPVKAKGWRWEPFPFTFGDRILLVFRLDGLSSKYPGPAGLCHLAIGLQRHVTMSSFSLGVGNLNMGCQARTVSILPIETSFQPSPAF